MRLFVVVIGGPEQEVLFVQLIPHTSIQVTIEQAPMPSRVVAMFAAVASVIVLLDLSVIAPGFLVKLFRAVVPGSDYSTPSCDGVRN
jgi:hypothetical protein